MKKPKVSIIIRTKNEEKWLEAVLKKLLQQTFRDFEIIIIDSGSTDKTLEIAQKFPVELIQIQPEEFNYSYALNLGISQAKGEFIAVISGHSVPIKNTWLENGLKNFKDQKIAGVSGYTYPLPDSPFYEKIGVIKGKKKIWHQIDNRVSLFPRKLWQTYPFDESLSQCEDYDWGQEMRARGFKLIHDPDFAVYHSHYSLWKKLKTEFWGWRKICGEINKHKRPRESFTKIQSLMI